MGQCWVLHGFTWRSSAGASGMCNLLDRGGEEHGMNNRQLWTLSQCFLHPTSLTGFGQLYHEVEMFEVVHHAQTHSHDLCCRDSSK